MVFVLGTTFQKCLSFRENVENSEVLLLRQMTKFSRIVILLLNPNGGGGLELMGGRGGSWERWEEGGGRPCAVSVRAQLMGSVCNGHSPLPGQRGGGRNRKRSPAAAASVN